MRKSSHFLYFLQVNRDIVILLVGAQKVMWAMRLCACQPFTNMWREGEIVLWSLVLCMLCILYHYMSVMYRCVPSWKNARIGKEKLDDDPV